MNDDNIQNALARLAADQEGTLPGLLGFRWTHALPSTAARHT